MKTISKFKCQTHYDIIIHSFSTFAKLQHLINLNFYNKILNFIIYLS